LQQEYRPMNESSNRTFGNIRAALRYDPAAERVFRQVEVYDLDWNQVTIHEEAVDFQLQNIPDILILHPPKEKIQLISFELEDVLDPILRARGQGIPELIKLFKAMKALGLKVAITSRAPGAADWYRSATTREPELSEVVDYFHQDYQDPDLGHYVRELGLSENEIMHIGNPWMSGFGSSSETHAGEIHKRGFISVSVNSTRVYVHHSEIFEKQIDGYVRKIGDIDTFARFVNNWVDVKPLAELRKGKGEIVIEAKPKDEAAESQAKQGGTDEKQYFDSA